MYVCLQHVCSCGCRFLFSIVANVALDVAVRNVLLEFLSDLVLDAANVGHGQAVPLVDPAEQLAVKLGEETTFTLNNRKNDYMYKPGFV